MAKIWGNMLFHCPVFFFTNPSSKTSKARVERNKCNSVELFSLFVLLPKHIGNIIPIPFFGDSLSLDLKTRKILKIIKTPKDEKMNFSAKGSVTEPGSEPRSQEFQSHRPSIAYAASFSQHLCVLVPVSQILLHVTAMSFLQGAAHVHPKVLSGVVHLTPTKAHFG